MWKLILYDVLLRHSIFLHVYSPRPFVDEFGIFFGLFDIISISLSAHVHSDLRSIDLIASHIYKVLFRYAKTRGVVSQCRVF